MSRVHIDLSGVGRCKVTLDSSAAVLRTALPPEYGGSGDSFSSTDLVAVGLGTCIATSVQAIALREGLDDSQISVEVHKILSVRPKRIKALSVQIAVQAELSRSQRQKIVAAAKTCPVHKSLNSDVEIEIRLNHYGAL